MLLQHENHVLNKISATVPTEIKFPELGGFELQEGLGEAYREEAFQYFLEIERKRAETSNRPFLLMLMDFKRLPGSDPSMDVATTRTLFSTLSQCLRETDFVGWYREGRVAGAVLTQHGEPEGHDLSEVVLRRVGDRLERQLPSRLARELQVRVYQLPPNANARGDQ